MSKQKPNHESSNLSGHFDRKAIHEAMLMAGGVQAEAHRILEKAGLTHTRKWLNDEIHKDRVLKAVWIDGSGQYSRHESPEAQLSPAKAREVESQRLQIEAEYMEQVGVESIFGEDSAEAMSFATFASKQFGTSVNMIYGISVKSAFDLRKRAEWIEANVLLNDETVTHHATDKEGNLITYDGPKYTEPEKLEWQKVHTDIMETLRKFGDSATNAAEAKIKAYKMSGKGGKGGGKSTRGKRDFN